MYHGHKSAGKPMKSKAFDYTEAKQSQEEKSIVLRVPEIGEKDIRKLQRFIEPDRITIEEEELPTGTYGEVTLATAIILLTITALEGLIEYLKHKNAGKSCKIEVEIEKNGTRIKKTLTYQSGSTESVKEIAAREMAEIKEIFK